MSEAESGGTPNISRRELPEKFTVDDILNTPMSEEAREKSLPGDVNKLVSSIAGEIQAMSSYDDKSTDLPLQVERIIPDVFSRGSNSYSFRAEMPEGETTLDPKRVSEIALSVSSRKREDEDAWKHIVGLSFIRVSQGNWLIGIRDSDSDASRFWLSTTKETSSIGVGKSGEVIDSTHPLTRERFELIKQAMNTTMKAVKERDALYSLGPIENLVEELSVQEAIVYQDTKKRKSRSLKKRIAGGLAAATFAASGYAVSELRSHSPETAIVSEEGPQHELLLVKPEERAQASADLKEVIKNTINPILKTKIPTNELPKNIISRAVMQEEQRKGTQYDMYRKGLDNGADFSLTRSVDGMQAQTDMFFFTDGSGKMISANDESHRSMPNEGLLQEFGQKLFSGEIRWLEKESNVGYIIVGEGITAKVEIYETGQVYLQIHSPLLSLDNRSVPVADTDKERVAQAADLAKQGIGISDPETIPLAEAIVGKIGDPSVQDSAEKVVDTIQAGAAVYGADVMNPSEKEDVEQVAAALASIEDPKIKKTTSETVDAILSAQVIQLILSGTSRDTLDRAAAMRDAVRDPGLRAKLDKLLLDARKRDNVSAPSDTKKSDTTIMKQVKDVESDVKLSRGEGYYSIFNKANHTWKKTLETILKIKR